MPLIFVCFAYVVNKYTSNLRNFTRHDFVQLQQEGVSSVLRQQLEFVFPECDDSEIDVIQTDFRNFQSDPKTLDQYLRLIPHMEEVLRILKSDGKKLGIVSSRSRPSLEAYLGRFGISGIFDVIVTPESTERHKPDPEPIFAALRELSPSGEINLSDVVYVGDMIGDMKCAANAGVDSVFVEWSIVDLKDVREEKEAGGDLWPTHVVSDPRELIPSSHVGVCLKVEKQKQQEG